jgi:transcriptional antiterminator NusG
MKYYVIQTWTGAEEKFSGLFRKRNPEVGADEIGFYFPCKKMVIRRQGKQLQEVSPIFPGYLFAEVDESVSEKDFLTDLKKPGDFFRVLPSNQTMRPLYRGELDVVGRFLLKNGEPVGLSQVKFVENQRIVVLSGPMIGLEGSIIKVDKRKKRAKIKIDMFETEMTIDLGFEVIGEAD